MGGGLLINIRDPGIFPYLQDAGAGSESGSEQKIVSGSLLPGLLSPEPDNPLHEIERDRFIRGEPDGALA